MATDAETKQLKWIFSTRLNKAIEASKLEESVIVEQTGIAKDRLTSFREGDSLPRLETFKPLCEVLDVTSNYLLGMAPRRNG